MTYRMMLRRSSLILLAGAVVAALLTATSASGQEEPRFRVLVYSKVTNFFHDSIPAGKAAIHQLATEHNFEAVVSDDSAMFTDETLAGFDAVIFNNTNSTPAAGDLLNAEQRAAFQRYIRAGGGYAGIHSASGTERDWEWYGQLVGAFFRSHPAIQELSVQVDDRVHPSTSGLPQEWVRTEEPYDFVTNPRGDVHVLASFDTRSYNGHVMGPDHPISWCQDFEGGRSWYTGMGHHSEAFSEPLFLQHLLGGIEWAAGAVEGDCGATDEERFEKIQLDGNTDDPLDIEIDDRGRVFFVERGGAVKYYDPADQFTHVAARFDVLVEHTHGMHGIVLDPNFDTNHWLYIYYSPLDRDVSLVSRFTFDEQTGTIDPDSERVLFELNSQREVNAHEGGGMAFDAAGNLYVATGDNSLPCCSGFGAIDERPGREYEDAQRSSGNTNDLRGKILRVHPEPDGSYTIPEGNLFAPGTEGTRPEIYVMGLRNPYRIHIDEETGWLYWGDVGPDAREDSETRGTKGYDEFNQAREAGNYGWPYCVGDNAAYRDYDFATGESGELFDCAGGPTNDSPNNTGLTQLPPAQPAWIHYPYTVSDQYPELGEGGRLAIGGPTYHFDLALDSERKFPAYYDDTVFIAEWTRNAIFEVKLDETGAPAIINRFLPHETFLRPIDMEFGNDGSMYVVEWGSNYGGSGRGDPNFDSGIYKINYVRPGERSPVARASASPTSGQPPLAVQFSSQGSGDPDEGDSISYAWDFDADGTTDSTEAMPTYTYTERGDYTARLTVTDSTGRTGVANIPVTVGNTAPEVELVEPLDGQIFSFGEPIPFQVEVQDAEDGSSGETIDCSTVVTQPSLGHDQHAHPLEQYTGCAGTIQSIVDEGHDANDNTFYVVESTYTDRGGEGVSRLSDGDSAVLQPRLKQAEHWTSAGTVQLYDTQEGDGGRLVGQIGHGDFLSFEPVNLRGVTEMVFRVASAGTGGTIEVRMDSVDGPLVGSAEVEPTGGSYEFTTVTAPVEDPGGSHELFLVFTNNPGDEYLFNLDWMQFANPLTDPVRQAWRANQEFTAAVEEHAASLDADQEQYLTDLAVRLDERLVTAWRADPAGEEFATAVNEALLQADNGRTWIANQLDSGALPANVATALSEPLDRCTSALSLTVARLSSVSTTSSTASEDVVAGETVRVSTTLRNDGTEPVTGVSLRLDLPQGWTADAVGPTDSQRVGPGGSFTATWDVTAPVSAEPGTVTLTGTATYRHRGESTVVLPTSARLGVVPAVEATAVRVPTPLLGGAPGQATVVVRNNRSATPVDVSVALDLPDGWTSQPQQATVAAESELEVEVPVTAPVDLVAGPLTTESVAARVQADGVPVAGSPSAQTYVVPGPDAAVHVLDSGSATSPLLAGYQRLAPEDAWDPAKGFGWITTTQAFRDRGAPDALRRDFTLSREPAVLRLQIPAGEHVVSLLRGDNSFSSGSTLVEVDGEVVVPSGGNLSSGNYSWEQFTLDGGPAGRTADLRIFNDAGNYWRLNALVVQQQ